MNEVLSSLGFAHWKPVITAVLMPPVPLLLLAIVGARLLSWRRSVGWMLMLLSLTGVWLSTTVAAGEWLSRSVLRAPPALDTTRPAPALREALRRRSVAIIVLGGGREVYAPEYRLSNLSAPSLERLRYGLWLGRELGAPVMFSGGVGYANDDGPAEAEIAARIAEKEFGRPLRWVEARSRDTRENGTLAVAMLRGQGIDHLVLVTHGWHMPRARRAFMHAVQRDGLAITLSQAPIGLAPRVERSALRWLPSSEGAMLVRQSLREAVGLVSGA